MIVDDSPDSAEPLARFLRKCGYAIKCVPNGREALAEVINSPPDAVILDLMMPDMDGPSFLEVIRSYLRLQRLPVVVLTGLPDGPMAQRARDLGVTSVLVKTKATFEDIERGVQQAAQRGQSP
jgi:two-component system, chemotaxis family, chemotaxis protein CheY